MGRVLLPGLMRIRAHGLDNDQHCQQACQYLAAADSIRGEVESEVWEHDTKIESLGQSQTLYLCW